MSLLIESQATPCKADPAIVAQLIECLTNAGYEPLIAKAKQKFAEVFGVKMQKAILSEQSTEMMFEYAYRRAMTRRYREDSRVPLAGDLFYTSDGKSILYLALIAPDSSGIRRRTKGPQIETQLEIGYIGDEVNRNALAEMAKVVSEYLNTTSPDAVWSPVQPSCPPFIELRQSHDNKFILASNLTEQELRLAEQLEDLTTRNLAVVIRRSGGILANDITKKAGTKPEQTQAAVEQLSASGLLAQEYVVICKKTSNQVNRVDSKEKIEKMTELGILCSCGNPIGQERIEELVSPTPILQKMLDQSYWMTARLVKLLKELNIPDECILLNLQEGAEEIDAFVDLEGTLLMFELKDNEFSMGHAYPFGGRIGLYKPDIAIIVSTKGVAPEVKEYFKRVKPAAEIVYVGSLNEFDNNLQRVITQTRSRRAQELISQFEPMASLDVPVAQMITTKLGMERVRPRGRTDDEIPF